ncbi:MAG: DNA primase [Bacilli bacterium]|jgi:DNA primase
MKLNKETIKDIRNKVNIVDVIAEYLPLVQKGKNYFAVCPFHDDHNPSMSISPERQIYTCFVCGASGNVYTFLMEYEQISFLEAVKKVAAKVGISLDLGQKYQKKVNQKEQYLYDIYEISNKFYQNNLNTKPGLEAKKYLKVRKIDEDVIKYFQIGLSLKGISLSKVLKEKFKEEEIEESGICSLSSKGLYDVFINRIMFPIWNLDGQVIGFSGRIYLDDQDAKYINSRESKIFKKGQLLYNYHQAKEEARRKKQIIIVEGFMDVIALYKIGLKNVVATMGTAITKEQASLIKKTALNIILCFDGDEAGERATLSCLEELVKLDLKPQIIRLPNNYDPDDYIEEKGKESFLSLLEQSQTGLDFKMALYKKNKNFQNEEDVSAYINLVLEELISIDDKVVKDVILNKLTKETNVSLGTLNSLLKKRQSKKGKKKFTIISKTKRRLNKYEQAEQAMLFYMLKDEGVIKMFKNNYCYLAKTNYRYLANEIGEFYYENDYIDLADFITFLGEKKELVNVLGDILKLNLPEKYTKEEITDYIKTLNEGIKEAEIERLTKDFQKEVEPMIKAEIAKKIINIKRGVDING